MSAERRIVLLSFVVGLVVWVGDALIDSLLMYDTSFPQALLGVHEPLDVFFRITVMIIIIACGLVVARMASRGHEAQVELEERNQFLQSVIDSIQNPFLVINCEDYSIELANAAVSEGDASSATACCYQVLHGQEQPCQTDEHQCPIQTVKQTGKPCITEHYHGSVPERRQTVEVQAYPIFSSDGEVVKVIEHCIDITERRRMEQRLIQTERLHAVGELAAGMCHNLNNMLTGLVAPAYLIDETSDPQAKELLEMASDAGKEVADLVKALNKTVRGGEGRTHAVSVNDVVEEAIQTTMPRWKSEAQARGISVVVIPKLAEVPKVEAISWDLENAIVHLILNSLDAMPRGGTITITTASRDQEVELTVHDTGVGMDEHTKARIFEPFFSTKVELGTGLGLAMVHSTITHWGGSVRVESTPNEGTRITMVLPKWTGPEEAPRIEEEPEPGRPAKVMAIDDEEIVLMVIERSLRDLHEVTTFTSGTAALEAFEPGAYDAVLIDLGMPGMPGNAVAEEIRKRDPSIAIILITGWVFSDDDPRLGHFDLALQKPFEEKSMLQAVVAQAVQLHDRRVADTEEQT